MLRFTMQHFFRHAQSCRTIKTVIMITANESLWWVWCGDQIWCKCTGTLIWSHYDSKTLPHSQQKHAESKRQTVLACFHRGFTPTSVCCFSRWNINRRSGREPETHIFHDEPRLQQEKRWANIDRNTLQTRYRHAPNTLAFVFAQLKIYVCLSIRGERFERKHQFQGTHLSSCIMGSVGTSTLGAWAIPSFKKGHTKTFAKLNLNFCMFWGESRLGWRHHSLLFFSYFQFTLFTWKVVEDVRSLKSTQWINILRMCPVWTRGLHLS